MTVVDERATDLPVVDFATSPDRYRHWRVAYDGDGRHGAAAGGRGRRDRPGLRAEDELLRPRRRHRAARHRAAAAVRASRGHGGRPHRRHRADVLRRRQHPDAGAVEPRLEGELLQVHQRDAQRDRGRDARASGQTWLAAVNGTAAGGGYELALACDEIVLVDDGSSTVSLPEVPLLGVIPGTGGLTRVVDKRYVRKDRADLFASKAEGFRASTAVEWGLVDASAPRQRWDEAITQRARELRVAVEPARRAWGHADRPRPHRHRRRGRLPRT